MKKLITILLLACFAKATAQAVGGGIVQKLPDASVKVITATFTKAYQKGGIPCKKEIYVDIEVKHNLPDNHAIPIRANYYLDNKLVDSLILIGNSFQKFGLGANNNSPYYPETVSSIDPKLKSKTKRHALIKPSSMGIDIGSPAYVIDKKFIYGNKRIQVKVPFEYSPEVGPLKLNKYEFYIDKHLYDTVLKSSVKDVQLSNNSDSKTFYQRCNSQELFVKTYPETFSLKEIELPKESGESNNKIINFLFPTDESLKPGKELNLSLFVKYEGKTLDLDNVKISFISLQGGRTYKLKAKKKIIGFTNQILIFDLPTDFPTGAYVVQVSYAGRTEGELFVVHK